MGFDHNSGSKASQKLILAPFESPRSPRSNSETPGHQNDKKNLGFWEAPGTEPNRTGGPPGTEPEEPEPGPQEPNRTEPNRTHHDMSFSSSEVTLAASNGFVPADCIGTTEGEASSAEQPVVTET